MTRLSTSVVRIPAFSHSILFLTSIIRDDPRTFHVWVRLLLEDILFIIFVVEWCSTRFSLESWDSQVRLFPLKLQRVNFSKTSLIKLPDPRGIRALLSSRQGRTSTVHVIIGITTRVAHPLLGFDNKGNWATNAFCTILPNMVLTYNRHKVTQRTKVFPL